MRWRSCDEMPVNKKDVKTAGRIRRMGQWDYFCAYWFDFFGYWSINGHSVPLLKKDNPTLECQWLDQGDEE